MGKKFEVKRPDQAQNNGVSEMPNGTWFIDDDGDLFTIIDDGVYWLTESGYLTVYDSDKEDTDVVVQEVLQPGANVIITVTR